MPSTTATEKLTTPSARNQSASDWLYCRKMGHAAIGTAIESAAATNARSTAALTCIGYVAAFARKPGGVVIAGPSRTKLMTGATAMFTSNSTPTMRPVPLAVVMFRSRVNAPWTGTTAAAP